MGPESPRRTRWTVFDFFRSIFRTRSVLTFRGERDLGQQNNIDSVFFFRTELIFRDVTTLGTLRGHSSLFGRFNFIDSLRSKILPNLKKNIDDFFENEKS